MNKTKVHILHSMVRYPILVISIPLQCISLALDYFTGNLEMLSLLWGEFLIRKFMSKSK